MDYEESGIGETSSTAERATPSAEVQRPVDRPISQEVRSMVQVRRMNQYQRDVRDEVADLIVEGFYAKFVSLTKDRSKLAVAFREGIRSDLFYVAELDGEIAGILAVSSSTRRALVADKASLRRGLGLVMGSIAYRALRKELNSHLPYGDDTGYIEWVATSGKARQRGVSTALFQHAMEHSSYTSFVLEVLDYNLNAYRLYAKLGFEEYGRKPAKGGEKTVFKERIYMRRDSPAPIAGP